MSIPTDPTQQPQQPAPEQPQPPQYAAPQPPAAPQYAAPQQPAPQQPQYAAPQQPAPQQPQYAAPQYAPQQPQYAAPVQRPTNTLSIIALISAFVLPFIVPVVLGHISLSQIKKTGEGGRGLALTAVILGYIEVAFWVIFIIALVSLFALAATSSYTGY